MKTVYLALGLLLLPGMLWAQGSEKENEFTMSMQIRPRAEYRNGAQLPRFEGDKAASFINNRARLSMEYKRSDLSMKISAQHVGVWGQDPQIDTNGRFIMNEAWANSTLVPVSLHNWGARPCLMTTNVFWEGWTGMWPVAITMH